MSETNETPTLPEYGILAEYKDPTSLVRACEKVRDAGYTNWDCYTPFPIHGIDPAMGIKPTRLPWLVFVMGITGTGFGVLMQWWTNAFQYPFSISGKPFFSLPANIPVAFETTVLFAALTAFFGALLFNGLPSFYNPLNKIKKFARATDNGFFLAIAAADSNYETARTETFLKDTSPVEMEIVADDSQVNAGFPPWMIYGGVITAFAALIPLAMIAKSTFTDTPYTRIHIVQNMDFQEKFKAQSVNERFADGRSMRADIQDTVAVGEANLDEHTGKGVVDGAFAWGLPEGMKLDAALLERGQSRFDIYCAPCHGPVGNGDGLVHQRAAALGQATWVQPTSVHMDHIRNQPDGKLFNTITNGIRNMEGYGHAMSNADRWAVVAYVRALQRSQNGTDKDVESSRRGELK